jgi:hypothetical protein
MRKYSILMSLVTVLLVIAFTLGIRAGDAQAIMLKISLDDLTTEADSIVIGTVEKSVSNWNEDRSAIYTTVTVSVEDDIKGEYSQNSVTIIVPGGEVDGITQTVSDTPSFETGEQAFFFLSDFPQTVLPRRQFSPKFYELQGNFQGKLLIEDDAVEGLPLALFEEELQSILDEGEAKYYFETNPDEPTLTSYNQFVTLPFRWPSSSIPVSYWVNASSDRNAHVQAAANSWSSAGANFSLNYRGTHSRSGGAFMNNKNEVMWNDLNTNTALAVATIWTSNNTILEADMTFNTRFNWSTDGWYGYDVQSVALHEFGHWVGLDHSPLSESIMYYGYKGSQRYLHSSDVAGIRHIYSATTSTITNDNFSSRIAVSGTSGQTTGSNINCTKEQGEPNHAGNSGGQSVWWEWVASASGLVEISTAGSNFDTLLGVYSGTSVSGLTAVASNDDYGMTYQSRVSFNAQQGVSYKIAVDGWVTSAGNVTISWLLTPDPCSISALTQPTGAATGLTGESYTYSTGGSACSNGHPLEYRFDWGDGTISAWSSSNQAGKTWTTPGSYQVKAQARCSVNTTRVSAWSTAQSVEIASPPVIYNLIIEVSGEGTTDPQVGSHTCDEGESVDLSATASEGWVFDKWIMGTAEFTDTTIKHTMTDHATATAVFVETQAEGDEGQNNNQDNDYTEDTGDGSGSDNGSETDEIPPVSYTLTVAVNGSGATDPEPGDHNHTNGTPVALQAIPADSWVFVKWVVNNTSEYDTALLTVTIEQNTTATAVFEETQAESGGNQDNDSTEDTSGVDTGSTQETDDNTASPPTHTDPSTNSSPPAPVQYALTIAVKGEGSSNPLPGEHRYDKDYSLVLSAKPAAGWGFEKWTVDGVDHQSNNINLTMDAVKMATAHFFKIEMGDITGSGTINVKDVNLVARHALGIYSLTGAQLEKADVNGDGVVNVLDVALIMRHALGLIDSFPQN